MTDDSSVDETAVAGQAIAEAAEAFWHMYLVLFTGCWGLIAAVSAPPASRPHRRPADEQLVVPEPIEDKGEYALFA